MPLIRWPRPRVESAAPVTRCTEYLLYSPNNQANFAVLFPKPWESPARRAAAARAVPSVYSPYRRWSSAPSSDGTSVLCDTSEHPKMSDQIAGSGRSLTSSDASTRSIVV
jgi:hypothetical protein